MNYEQKKSAFKICNALNLKKNTMKGGAHMEIKLTKELDGSIKILLPPDFGNKSAITFIFEEKLTL